MSTHGEYMYWTEERWREWADYADEVKVRVKFVDGPINENRPEEVWSFEFGPEHDWDRQWLERHLAELATTDESSCCGHGNYTMDSKASRTEWGASGAVHEIVMSVSTGILSAALWHAFLKIANTASSRAAVSPTTAAGDAIEHSKRRVANHLGRMVSVDDLTILSAAEEASEWTIQVQVNETGDIYTVVTATTPNGCPVSRVTKTQLVLKRDSGTSTTVGTARLN